MTFDYEDFYEDSHYQPDIMAELDMIAMQHEQLLAAKEKTDPKHTSCVGGGGDASGNDNTDTPENTEARSKSYESQNDSTPQDNTSNMQESNTAPENSEQDIVPTDREEDGSGAPTQQDVSKEQGKRSSTEHSHSIPKDGRMILSLESKISFPKPAKSEADKINEIKSLKNSLSKFETYEDFIAYAKEYVANGQYMDSELFFLYHTVYTLPQPWKYFTFFRDSLFSYNAITDGKRREIERFVAGIDNKK